MRQKTAQKSLIIQGQSKKCLESPKRKKKTLKIVKLKTEKKSIEEDHDNIERKSVLSKSPIKQQFKNKT